MVSLLRSLAFAAIVPLVCSARLCAEGVHIVGNPAAGVFRDVQSAVDAAADGDVLLLGNGSYEPFTIDGKGVSVFPVFPGSVLVRGTVVVRNLPAGRHVVLADLGITGAERLPQSDPALLLEDNAGQVRLERCTLRGGLGLDDPANCKPHGAGGHAVVANSCARLSMAECWLVGGSTFHEPKYGNDECFGGRGGDGLRASTAVAALYHCTLIGGMGGNAGTQGGAGGDGCRISVGGIVAVGSSFRGGDGGRGWHFFGFGGDGGDGLYVDANTQAQLVDDTFAGGAGGFGWIMNGAPGSQRAGPGTFRFHPGVERRFYTTRGVFIDDAGAGIGVAGEPGDFVWMPMAFRPGWRVPQPVRGIWLIPLGTKMPLVPFGVLPPSGSLTRTLPLPDIQVDGMLLYAQGWALDVAREGHIGGPVHLLALDRDGQPDCDGDGVQDFVQILLGLAPDCDHNLVPDPCDPDCNGNGVSDGCDIASGTSQDLNQNGVPDECEAGATWFVDDSAPPGGDGSMARPFRTIAEGIAASVSSDTVVVLDGTYTGAGNRGLDFGGRNLVLRSQNGPAACVVDCQRADRAFWFHSGEGRAARIEGLTIRNGTAPQDGSAFRRGGGILVESASPTIRGCVIEGCWADLGGGVHTEGGWPLLEECRFEANGFSASVRGGAVAIRGRATLLLCTIEGNRAGAGGGVYVEAGNTPTSALLSHCRILANDAAQGGGGVNGMLRGNAMAELILDDCLIAGNEALSGGGLHSESLVNNRAHLRISGCTFAGNSASDLGGAVYAPAGDDGSLVNTILWGNSAPNGPQVALGANFQAGAFSVAWSDLEGGQGMVLHSGALAWGPGNIALDPLFTDPDGPDNDPTTFGDNDYTLGAGSPCIDAADNLSVPPDRADVDGDGNVSEPVPLDLALAPRFSDDPAVPDTGNGTPPVVDMGAYERP